MNRWLPEMLFAITLSGCIASSSPESTATAAPPALSPAELGRQVYAQECAECHGENGEGYANELAAPALDAGEHAWHHPDQQICEWVILGKLGLGREMPGLGGRLSTKEVVQVIAYLHTLWTPDQLAAQQDTTARWPESSLPDCQFEGFR